MGLPCGVFVPFASFRSTGIKPYSRDTQRRQHESESLFCIFAPLLTDFRPRFIYCRTNCKQS